MLSKAISCSGCGHEGPRDMPGALREQFEKDFFSSRGHDPYTGMLLYRCPAAVLSLLLIRKRYWGTDLFRGIPAL